MPWAKTPSSSTEVWRFRMPNSGVTVRCGGIQDCPSVCGHLQGLITRLQATVLFAPQLSSLRLSLLPVRLQMRTLSLPLPFMTYGAHSNEYITLDARGRRNPFSTVWKQMTLLVAKLWLHSSDILPSVSLSILQRLRSDSWVRRTLFTLGKIGRTDTTLVCLYCTSRPDIVWRSVVTLRVKSSWTVS